MELVAIEIMLESLIVSLVLTICIELSVALLIGVREKNDILTVIMVNVLTNPVVVFIVNLLGGIGVSETTYWIVLVIMEILAVVIEGKIFEKILKFKGISGTELALANNLISFLIGVIIGVVSANGQIKIEAASAFYLLAQEMFSQSIFNARVEMRSTNEVYADIINGQTDVIIATKPSSEQAEMIKKSGVELEFLELYEEPLTILINEANNVDNLDIEQIQEIYYGDNLDWNTYQLEKNNGSQTCFESVVKNNTIGVGHYEIGDMAEIIDRVALDKKGIGYAFYSYYFKMHKNANAKIVNVNSKDIEDQNYPLRFMVYLIYQKDNEEDISKVVEWVKSKDYWRFIEK